MAQRTEDIVRPEWKHSGFRTSYYPSLAITQRLFPEHLGETFYEIYTDMKAQRVKYPKGTPENGMLKLALNGVFGDSNSRFSPFYDPQYTMAITVNGQLLLCMLYEALRQIEGLQLIQMNTDGVTVKLPRAQVDALQTACKAWESLTGLELEEARYDFMHIRDCNNYVAKFEGSDKVKRKGAYEYDIDWHQNHSALVVKKAAEVYITHGADIGEFIFHHDDDHDFMLRTKVPRTSSLVGIDDALGVEWPMQNITRYYIGHDGVELMKIMPPLPKKPDHYRRIAVNKGLKVVECNKLKPIDRARLNYDWYVKEAQALVNFS